jgi:predicted NBD/HSP70 family sugar kinase
MNALGIDIGGTSVKMALVQDGTTLWTGKSESYARPDTQQLVDAIRAAAQGRVSGADAVGLCVPGLLDRPRRVITLAVNVPGLMNIPLDDLVSRSLGVSLPQVEILNDAVSTGYDLATTLGLQGRLLVIALGTGVGAAVLDDGSPLKVEGESPGHIGQMDVSIEGEPVIGPDGGAGSLEGYIGTHAMIQRYGPNMAATLAKLTVDDAPLRALVRTVRICHAMYRPHHIALTGGIGIRLNRLLPQIRQRIETHLTSVAREGWTFTTGQSDYHAAVGAAKLAQEKPQRR